MKKIYLLLLYLVFVHSVYAQLSIMAGTGFFISGNMPVTLHNTSFINKGNFFAGNSRVIFSGDASSYISGTRPVQFYELELQKSAGQTLLLTRNIEVQQRIWFGSGLLDLNGFDIALSHAAQLENEHNNSRITGNNGGQVLFSALLNAPVAVNAGNLGISITAAQNLGNVLIKRGHQSQAVGNGAGNSILRYYDIVASNNSNLNATIKFTYTDAELNGINENKLQLYKSDDATNWQALESTTTNVAGNSIEKTGIHSFSRFTVSGRSTFSIPLTTGYFNLSPNPFRSEVVIHLVSDIAAEAIIKVFDSKGALVKVLTRAVVQGGNQLKIDCVSLQEGVYSIQVEWNNGKIRRTVQAIKLH